MSHNPSQDILCQVECMGSQGLHGGERLARFRRDWWQDYTAEGSLLSSCFAYLGDRLNYIPRRAHRTLGFKKLSPPWPSRRVRALPLKTRRTPRPSGMASLEIPSRTFDVSVSTLTVKLLASTPPTR
ncbi:hypothetical protein Gbem_4104 [Citrifermentans bemidjiense Bem]|uniref:Uncharacterized protein n=1 Tax=Citrifermentans bemidjiense (strain ATCC BAA-1014 / DSM 16622 / JCM 12645 / Bem) TaxID=404380 RepID=E1P6A8_CITBB|nr:hypothetical protein Gbem_4104 [Citrifermentans bemidjiense Bem]